MKRLFLCLLARLFHFGQKHRPRPIGKVENLSQNILRLSSVKTLPTHGTVRRTRLGKEHANIVIRFRERPHCRSRRARDTLLIDRYRWTQVGDKVHVRPIKSLHEMPRIRRDRLHVPTIRLRMNSIEGKRRFPRPRQPRNHHKFLTRNIHVHSFQIVYARTPNLDYRAFGLLLHSRVDSCHSSFWHSGTGIKNDALPPIVPQFSAIVTFAGVFAFHRTQITNIVAKHRFVRYTVS